MPSAAVTGSLLVLLVIAGFALVISQFGGSSSSSGSASGAAAASASAPAASSEHSSQLGAAAGRCRSTRPPAWKNGLKRQFVVTESGTKYQGSTLASQVREQLDALNRVP